MNYLVVRHSILLTSLLVYCCLGAILRNDYTMRVQESYLLIQQLTELFPNFNHANTQT